MRYATLMYLSYAAVYLGCAEGAFAEMRRHVLERSFPATGAGLARIETVQRYVGEMQISLDRTRALVYTVARAADDGAITEMTPLMTAVVAADETALDITQTAMTVGGGIAYARHNALERYLRDARAAPVMAPVDDVTKLAVGRAVLGT
jgi:isovaleryl-CoA dehydrogenase